MKKIILHLEKLSFFASKTFLFFIIFILLLICTKKLSVQWEETENNKKLKRPYDGAIQSISTGYTFACAVDAEKKSFCWGNNNWGYLGIGHSGGKKSIPQFLKNLNDASQISLSYNRSYGVTAGGDLYRWGDLPSYYAGGTINNAPGCDQGTGSLTDVSQESSGCSVTTTGSVFCFGDKVVGLNGIGHLENIVQVSVGGNIRCVVDIDGKVYCWKGDKKSSIPIQVLGGEQGGKYLQNVVQISISEKLFKVDNFQYQNKKKSGHACVVTTNGEVYCWGENYNGQLGNGKNEISKVPVRVLGGEQGDKYLKDVKHVSSGFNYTCTVTKKGEVYCWGANECYDGQGYSRQLGNGKEKDTSIPTRVLGGEQGGKYLRDIVQVSTGYGFACARTTKGELYCWGRNRYGQLATGTFDKEPSPTPIKIYNGKGKPPCNSKCCAHWNYSNIGKSCPNGGTYKCFGAGNDYSVVCHDEKKKKLKENLKFSNTITPTYPMVNKITDAEKKSLISITTKHGYTCGITKDNNKFLYCWEENKDRSSNLLFSGKILGGEQGGKYLTGVSQISVGDDFACAVVTNGEVYCWGNNWNGRLGNGENGSSSIPVKVLGGEQGGKYLTGVSQLSVENGQVCAVTTNGEVYCWGNNESRWSEGRKKSSRVPLRGFSGEPSEKYLRNIVHVSGHCGVTAEEEVYCWDDYYSHAYKIEGKYLKGIRQVSVGDGFACAVVTNGEVYCWGNNFYGQLGNGKEEYSKVPVRVLGGEQGGNFLKNVSQIFINGGQDYPYDYQACALTTNEEIYCWGGTDKEEFLAPVRVFSSEDKKNYLIKTVYESEYCTVTGEGKKYCLNKEFQKIIFDKIRSSSNNSTCSTHWNYSKVGEICPSGKKYKCYEKDGNFSVVCPYRKLRKNVKADDSDKTKISFESISTGLNHACGITKDNNKFLYCWGDNLFGELGNNSLRYSLKVEPIPVQVLGGEQGGKYLRDIKGVSAGYAHTCAVTIKGEVYCWGNNECGQLGRSKNPYPVSSSLPLKVIGGRQGGEYLKDIVQVSAGYNHTCAVTTNGEVYCWGDRKHIKKKYIKNTSYVPIKILGGEQGGKYLQDIKQVSFSFNKDRYYSYCHDNCTCYVCALTTKGEVYCWGDNKDLGLGNVKKGNSLVPVKVDGGEQGGKYLQDISKIYLGNSYTCAITKNKEAYCWGRLREKRKVLVPEKVIDNIEQIYIEQIPYGYDFFALTTNGKVFCPYKDSLPVKSISRDFGFFKKGGEQRKKYLKNVVQISSGGDFSCALTDNGSAYCWGNSHFGQLGNGMGIGHVIKYDGPTEVVIDPSKVL